MTGVRHPRVVILGVCNSISRPGRFVFGEMTRSLGEHCGGCNDSKILPDPRI